MVQHWDPNPELTDKIDDAIRNLSILSFEAGIPLGELIRKVRRGAVNAALDKTRDNKNRAARLLGITNCHIRYYLKRSTI